jgi:aspartyl-tRNA(Asn)/glutamyl-tRNA(Gln) amidotransferase subunit C
MSPKKLSIDEVEKIAHLARLKLSPQEKEEFAGQLSSVLEYIDKISELDLKDVEPLAHVGELSNVWREDVVEKTDIHDQMMKIAPEAKRGHFRVPRIIEE